MPPKKAAAAPATKKTAAGHASYRDMIKDAIVNLKERNGSSRQSIKKYVKNNNSNLNNVSPAVFDNQFNRAIKAGVDKGEFTQPKGPSGPLKLAKKDAAEKPAAKKAAPAKAAAPKKAAAKKTDKAEKTEKAPKTEKTTTKTTAKKATTATKKKTAAKPKANIAKPRKTPVAAPAIIEKPKVTSMTKSGRVTKTTAPEPAAPKRAATKKE